MCQPGEKLLRDIPPRAKKTGFISVELEQEGTSSEGPRPELAFTAIEAWVRHLVGGQSQVAWAKGGGLS